MNVIYTIKDYIRLIQKKRNHFYYLNQKSNLYRTYTKKALKAINNILKMLKGFDNNSNILVDADGNFRVWAENYPEYTDLASGRFNCELLGGMQ